MSGVPMDIDRLQTLERGFWAGDAEYYEAHLAEAAVMHFPGSAGVLDRAQTIASIRSAPRWSHVDMQDTRMFALSDGCIVLTYAAAARRDDDEMTYRAQVTSVYVREGEDWKLGFHQQVPHE